MHTHKRWRYYPMSHNRTMFSDHDPSSGNDSSIQGLTLVHFSAQPELIVSSRALVSCHRCHQTHLKKSAEVALEEWTTCVRPCQGHDGGSEELFAHDVAVPHHE